MTSKRKTWQEKLVGNPNLPKTLHLAANFPCLKALQKQGATVGASVVLAPGPEISEIMDTVPKGKLLTLSGLCERLAKKHGTQFCCTLTTGIYVTIAAQAAEESHSPLAYWRTLKEEGELNSKYPGGLEQHRRLLETEGYTILQKGKTHPRYFVKDFEQYLLR